MDQLRKLFRSLSLTQRVTIPLVLLALIGGLTSFVRWRHETDFKPLFSAMPPEDAAAIVQKLKESGTEHRLSDNGTSVLVPSSRVDELRLEMSAAGLPRAGRIGFELFDKTSLGITDFTEHINYRRALEGELERSVRSIDAVEQARIHISFPKDSVFLDSREPAKASVLLSLRPGARLNDTSTLAITNLVASAVEGLTPEQVSVVDMRGTLLSKPRKGVTESNDPSDAALEFKHQLEKDLTAKVQSTLTPLLGEDRFRIGISADCDFSTSELTDETFDPTRSVMTNSQKAEDVSNTPQPSGVPGTASNLPRPNTAVTRSPANVSRRTENVSYETSRTVRQTKIPRGSVKRLSASLLIDQEVQLEGTGKKVKRVYVSASPEKIKAIHDIVAGLIGFSAERGDQLVIQSLPFDHRGESDLIEGASDSKASRGNAAAKSWMQQPMVLVGAGVGALVLVGAVAMILIGRRKKATLEVSRAAELNAPAHEKTEPATLPEGNPQEHQVPQIETPASSQISMRIEALRNSVQESFQHDPAVIANVIRGWMQEEEAA